MSCSTSRFAALLLCVASSANAATIFQEDFDSQTLGLNQVPTGWSVTNGSIDLIGSGFFDLLPGNGRYVDLDGSTSDAGVLSRFVSLEAGVKYNLAFDLAGSQRPGTETVEVSFGTVTASYVLPSLARFQTMELSFTPATTADYSISFANSGGDNSGALLDRVVVSSVPEVATLPLIALGLFGLSLLTRRAQPGRG